jgi:hypothetical protein
VSLRKQEGEPSRFDANTLKRQSVFASRDELAHIAVGSSRLRLPEGHQNHCGEKHAESLEAGIDLAARHAQQSGCKSGGSDQQRHDAIPMFDSGLKTQCNGQDIVVIPLEWEDGMGILYVARSAKLCRWASDVGLGKHVYKVGVAPSDPKGLAAAGWAGETDWTITRKQRVDDLSEEEALARLARKEKVIEPSLYPKLKGANGVFRLAPTRVESHIIVTRALAGQSDRVEVKLKPTDFADYLIHNTLR